MATNAASQLRSSLAANPEKGTMAALFKARRGESSSFTKNPKRGYTGDILGVNISDARNAILVKYLCSILVARR